MWIPTRLEWLEKDFETWLFFCEKWVSRPLPPSFWHLSQKNIFFEGFPKAQLNTCTCVASVCLSVYGQNWISPNLHCFIPPYAPLCPFVPLYAPFGHFMPLYAPFWPFIPLCAPSYCLHPFTSLYTSLQAFTCFYMLYKLSSSQDLVVGLVFNSSWLIHDWTMQKSIFNHCPGSSQPPRAPEVGICNDQDLMFWFAN